MAMLELFSEGMFFKTARSLIQTIFILFTTNFKHVFKITSRKEVRMEFSIS